MDFGIPWVKAINLTGQSNYFRPMNADKLFSTRSNVIVEDTNSEIAGIAANILPSPVSSLNTSNLTWVNTTSYFSPLQEAYRMSDLFYATTKDETSIYRILIAAMIGPYQYDVKDLIYFKLQKSTLFKNFYFDHPTVNITNVGQDYTTPLGLLIPKNRRMVTEEDFISSSTHNLKAY